ncbi:MAG: FAD-dependent oxidoreductase [Deltaproteobacteria bacterium]|nr:FAD-dependent oxidoreductase [Deltaproteobacteria bacterium]
MEKLFDKFSLGNLELQNRFVFPPVKLGYGNPDGTVTDRQMIFYRQVANNGPGLLILEPVSVTQDGKEHPKQLCVHLEGSSDELRKIVDVIHEEGRLACLHLNHAGAVANPAATKTQTKAPFTVKCAASGQESEILTTEEIKTIISGYNSASKKAVKAGFDAIEIQAGHGYLISQFLNGKINKRKDAYGSDRLLFAREAITAVKESAKDLPIIIRISGNEMSPEYGLDDEDLANLLNLAQESGACAIHVGMGNACFSPAWFFHHGSLPDKPQMDALARVREYTALPVIAAGRMGRKQKAAGVINDRLADIIALGRPLIADPDLIEKWQNGMEQKVISCGYCLQGCLNQLKSGKPLGCNFNPETGVKPLASTTRPIKALIAGGGPAGMSAALHMTRRGHKVTLFEKSGTLGGQFNLAWSAPGKETMRDALENMSRVLAESGATITLNRAADADLLREIKPDLLIWSVGAEQYIPDITGLSEQYYMTSLEFFRREKEVRGPRVLVIGAGRTGLEAAEMLGKDGYEVVATKRTDPIGSQMEMITKNLALARIGKMPKVILMPHTTVKAFLPETVDIEKDGVRMSLEPFQTVILATGMLSAPAPDEESQGIVPDVKIIGDAEKVMDIFTAIRAGYQLAQDY